jgi:transposase InsO family protein
MESLTPKNHLEEVALFRHGLIGEIANRVLARGERVAELRRISEQRVRPPGCDTTRCYSVPTLERWLYAFRKGGLPALAPQGRSDRGRGRSFDPVLKELLCDIRREYPDVSVTLMLRTLRADGRIGPDVKECTVRRMLCEKGLPRTADTDDKGPRARFRWQAERPNALWHGDVCHGPTLTFDGRRTHVRVHALLDDASRCIVGIKVAGDEREETMLQLFSGAVMEHGRPDVLYLDNGSTYRGVALATVCSRLGTGLRHAKPYDAAARGKMERFWRRMREEALDHIGGVASLEDIEAKLRIWLSRFYQCAPHSGLLGRAPAVVFAEGDTKRISEAELRAALTMRVRRRVRRDSTVSVDGVTYEVPLGYLAGQVVTIATSLFDGTAPFIELDDKRVPLSLVDPVRNGRRHRPPKTPAPARAEGPIDFDPSRAMDVDDEEDADDELFLPRRLRSQGGAVFEGGRRRRSLAPREQTIARRERRRGHCRKAKRHLAGRARRRQDVRPARPSAARA